MKSARRLAVLAILATVANACATDKVPYDETWTGATFPIVVRHGDELVLVGIDTEHGAAHALAPISGLPAQEGRMPEAASLVVSGTSIITVTDGSDNGVLLQEDVTSRRLTKLGELVPARLPLARPGGLTTIGGSGPSFRGQDVDLSARPGASRPLHAVPMFSDGHCLVGVQGNDAATETVLVDHGGSLAEPRVLTGGTPGGVWCDDKVGLVTVAALPGPAGSALPGDELLVVRPERVERLKVPAPPGLIAGDTSARYAAVVLQGVGQVKTFDLQTGEVVMSATLPADLQPNALTVRNNRIVVLGGNRGAVIPLHGGTVADFPLPGDNVTTVLH